MYKLILFCSFSCDDLVWNLSNVLALAREVAAFGVGLHECQLHPLSQGQRICVVKHVRLVSSVVAFGYSGDRYVGLRQPLSLDVNTLLGVSSHIEILTLKV
jgi:hypothetical protein